VGGSGALYRAERAYRLPKVMDQGRTDEAPGRRARELLVTLVLCAVRPGDGAWMCADRLTAVRQPYRVADDDASKVIHVDCVDGPLLIGFAGLAEMERLGNPLASWIRETVRGPGRNIVGTVQHLCDRVNRDTPRAWRNEPLYIVATGFSGIGGGWWDKSTPVRNGRALAFYLTNVTYRRDRTREIHPLAGKGWAPTAPEFQAIGSGVRFVSAEDRTRMATVLARRPAVSPAHYLGLLGRIIRDAAKRDPQWVSPQSFGHYIAADGSPGVSGAFPVPRQRGLPERAEPFLLRGVDVTELMDVFLSSVDLHGAGEMTDAEFTDRMNEAGRRATEPHP